ncbi:hypothetical protein RIF29_39174 [Crotalaria pallida]|uniref:Uncharacterized protein n=1 Tax=Crotalaria pallida TaxID=3830 RepID=A0AAN9E0M1_CROPI
MSFLEDNVISIDLQTYGYSELTTSVPSTEIVGKSDYFRFEIRDQTLSLLKYAECSVDPAQHQHQHRPSSFASSSTTINNVNNHPSSLIDEDEERVGVPVKGGLYKIDPQGHGFESHVGGMSLSLLREWLFSSGQLACYDLEAGLPISVTPSQLSSLITNN